MKYTMCKLQLAQIDCQDKSCAYHTHKGCNHEAPVITISGERAYCWTRDECFSVSGKNNKFDNNENDFYKWLKENSFKLEIKHGGNGHSFCVNFPNIKTKEMYENNIVGFNEFRNLGPSIDIALKRIATDFVRFKDKLFLLEEGENRFNYTFIGGKNIPDKFSVDINKFTKYFIPIEDFRDLDKLVFDFQNKILYCDWLFTNGVDLHNKIYL